MSVSRGSSAGRLFLRRLGIVGLVVLTSVAVWSVWGMYQKMKESAVLRSQAEMMRADLSARYNRLQVDIANLQTGRGIEELLRQQYALAARGEGLITIIEPASPPLVEATTTLFQKIKRVFWWW